MKTKYRLGVIGLGLISREHLEAYRQLDAVDIVSVCDVRGDTADRVAQDLSARAYTDYRELLQDGGIDMAVVLTPASTHCEIVQAAAKAGVHVFCEKPLAVTLSDGEEMVRACADAGVKFFYGSSYRYLPAVRKARDLILAGDIGRIQLMSEQLIGGNGLAGYRQLNEVHYPHDGPGGAGMGLVDHGVHLIDIFSWYAGCTPDHVTGHGQISGAPADTEYMIMHFPTGATGVLLYNAATYTAGLPNEGMFSGGQSWYTDGTIAPPGVWLDEPGSISVYGTEGSLRIFHYANALFINRGDGPKRVPLEGCASPLHFATQLEDCIAAVEENRKPSVSGEDAVQALKVLLAAYKT